MARSSTTLDSTRAAVLGRVAAATKWQRLVTPKERRQAVRAALEARAAKRLDHARAKVAELGVGALSLAELSNLARSLEAERIARLCAPGDAAGRRQGV